VFQHFGRPYIREHRAIFIDGALDERHEASPGIFFSPAREVLTLAQI
jgi:hypothetical protein